MSNQPDMSDASADSAVSHGPTPRPPRKYSAVDEFERFAYTNPMVSTAKDLDHKILFDIHRQAMAKAIKKAMNNQPDIDWLLENQDKITHKYYQMGLDGKI